MMRRTLANSLFNAVSPRAAYASLRHFDASIGRSINGGRHGAGAITYTRPITALRHVYNCANADASLTVTPQPRIYNYANAVAIHNISNAPHLTTTTTPITEPQSLPSHQRPLSSAAFDFDPNRDLNREPIPMGTATFPLLPSSLPQPRASFEPIPAPNATADSARNIAQV